MHSIALETVDIPGLLLACLVRKSEYSKGFPMPVLPSETYAGTRRSRQASFSGVYGCTAADSCGAAADKPFKPWHV